MFFMFLDPLFHPDTSNVPIWARLTCLGLCLTPHQLSPPSPNRLPFPPTSPHLYNHPQCARTWPVRETEQPGWLRRDESGATSTPTTDVTTNATTQPPGVEGLLKGMENPQGGWGGKEMGTRHSVQGTPIFFFFFRILLISTTTTAMPPPEHEGHTHQGISFMFCDPFHAKHLPSHRDTSNTPYRVCLTCLNPTPTSPRPLPMLETTKVFRAFPPIQDTSDMPMWHV